MTFIMGLFLAGAVINFASGLYNWIEGRKSRRARIVYLAAIEKGSEECPGS
jgi:hypothetical protein